MDAAQYYSIGCDPLQTMSFRTERPCDSAPTPTFIDAKRQTKAMSKWLVAHTPWSGVKNGQQGQTKKREVQIRAAVALTEDGEDPDEGETYRWLLAALHPLIKGVMVVDDEYVDFIREDNKKSDAPEYEDWIASKEGGWSLCTGTDCENTEHTYTTLSEALNDGLNRPGARWGGRFGSVFTRSNHVYVQQDDWGTLPEAEQNRVRRSHVVYLARAVLGH